MDVRQDLFRGFAHILSIHSEGTLCEALLVLGVKDVYDLLADHLDIADVVEFGNPCDNCSNVGLADVAGDNSRRLLGVLQKLPCSVAKQKLLIGHVCTSFPGIARLIRQPDLQARR